MYCPNPECGRKCNPKDTFCGTCGTPLRSQSSATTWRNSPESQPAITPPPGRLTRRTTRTVIISVSLTVFIGLGWWAASNAFHASGQNPTTGNGPLVHASPTPTTDTSQSSAPTATDTPSTGNTGNAVDCPSPSDVAQDIGEPDVTLVTRIQGWPCDFKLADSNRGKQVHCPGTFNASMETAVVPSGNLVIYWCPKGAATSMNIYGATIYDADIDTEGGACTVLAKTPGATVSGINC